VSDDYLWDRSGERDPEVERLERLLAPLRGNRPAPVVPSKPRHRSFPGIPVPVAAAASFVLAITGLWLAVRGRGSSWEVTRLVGGEPVARVERLRVGEWLETDAASRARLEAGLVGQVEIEPRTRLRLVDAGAAAHRLDLARGGLHARIWAPPGRFFVDTPAAMAVDLGCEYTLEVADDGSGLLRVLSGWVGFEYRGTESFVPSGAVCATRPGVGPGTPYYADAPAELKDALATLDFGPAAAGPDALRRALAAARRADAVSLWHLLARRAAADRGLVYDRLAVLVPPPPGVTREGVIAGDHEMLDRWWEALDLGSAGWWRQWKAPWPGTPSPTG